jgi:hypothetical protein
MKRYWLFRSGILQHNRPMDTLEEAAKIVKQLYADQSKGTKSQLPKEFTLVEEELRYSVAGTYRIKGKKIDFQEAQEASPKPRLGDVVDLVMPRHVMDKKMPRELLEQNEALLTTALARARKGQHWDG